jgi:hypothetical protein
MKLILIGVIMFSLFGCKKEPEVKTTTVDFDVSVKEVSGEVPRFKRIYSTTVNGIFVEVSIYNWGSSLGLMKSGMLTQRNGRWVSFDPEAVADKILDPDLAPKVQEFSNEVIRLDKQFRSGPPTEFKDEDGTVWRRVN